MKNHIGFFAILTIAVLALHAQNDPLGVPIYTGDVARAFLVGAGVNELGFRAVDSGASGPVGLDFGPDGKLYVTDPINRRLVVLDSSLTWETVIPGAFDVGIDVREDGIFVPSSAGIIKIDFAGNRIFDLYLGDIYYNNRPLSRQTYGSESFVVIDDFVAVYLTNGEVLGFTGLSPDYRANERIAPMNPSQTVRRLQQLAPRNNYSVGSVGGGGGNSSVQGRRMPGESLTDSAMVYRNGRPLVRDPRVFFDLDGGSTDRLSTIHALETHGGSVSPTFGAVSIPSDIFEDIMRTLTYIGEDGAARTVWYSRPYFLIFDSQNTFLDIFTITPRRTGQITVSADGDLYFMRSEPTGHTLYRVTRRW